MSNSYPLDKPQFIAWAKQQNPDTLVSLKLNLLKDKTDLNVQLEHTQHLTKPPLPSTTATWRTRAQIKLRSTEWRLQVVETLLEQGSLAFQKAAYQLLDRDTYITILEAADAARVG